MKFYNSPVSHPHHIVNMLSMYIMIMKIVVKPMQKYEQIKGYSPF